jgi:hypothetical protein
MKTSGMPMGKRLERSEDASELDPSGDPNIVFQYFFRSLFNDVQV